MKHEDFTKTKVELDICKDKLARIIALRICEIEENIKGRSRFRISRVLNYRQNL